VYNLLFGQCPTELDLVGQNYQTRFETLSSVEREVRSTGCTMEINPHGETTLLGPCDCLIEVLGESLNVWIARNKNKCPVAYVLEEGQMRTTNGDSNSVDSSSGNGLKIRKTKMRSDQRGARTYKRLTNASIISPKRLPQTIFGSR
jgi:hypothetical protein